MTLDPQSLRQAWPRPSHPRPIVIIGAGGIVNDAHLPAYRKAGFPVAGLFDLDRGRSEATAETFGIERVFGSLAQALGTPGAVFDLAVPPEHTFGVLEQVPDGATVLMQKPLGATLADAMRIRERCREKSLVAAVNFQLRFSPALLAIRDAVDRGLLGALLDIELRLNVQTPWELFPFLKKLDRVEILVHSVHYLDLIRSLLGEPTGVYARTIRHPRFPDLASTRTSAILDYGDRVRCSLSINHAHPWGPRHEAAMFKVEGEKGAAVTVLGLLMNYPEGKPDELEIITEGQPWTPVELGGCWFPDAFIGTMSNVQRFAAGEDEKLVSSVEDAYKTMALVEACYTSSAQGATPVPGGPSRAGE